MRDIDIWSVVLSIGTMSSRGNYTLVPLEEVCVEGGVPKTSHEGQPTPPIAQDENDETEKQRIVQRNKTKRKRLNSTLLSALKENDSIQVKRLLTAGASPNSRCRENSLMSACHLTALEGHTILLALLIRHGAALGARDRLGRQPHHIAAAANHRACLHLILQTDHSLLNSVVSGDTRGEEEISDELCSFLHNHTEMRDELEPMTRGSSALHIASKHGNIDIVNLLLDEKCDYKLKDEDRRTALDVAGLLSTKLPGTIVSAAIPALPVEATSPNVVVAVKRSARFKHSISAPTQTSTGTTPPPEKTDKSHEDVVKALKDIGAVFTMPDLQKEVNITILHTFIEKYICIDILEKGFKEYPDVLQAMMKCKDDRGRGPIHLAVVKNNKDVLKFLLSKDPSNANFLTSSGMTALDLAISLDWTEGVLELLNITDLNKGNIFHSAAEATHSNDNYNIINELLEQMESLTNREAQAVNRVNSGYTPFLILVKRGKINCMELFIDFFKRTKDRFTFDPVILCDGSTAFHLALESDSAYEAISLLSDYKELSCLQYDINSLNNDGLNALHVAALKGHTDSFTALVRAGASLCDVCDRKVLKSEYRVQGTVLHLAADKGNTGIIMKVLDPVDGAPNMVNMLNIQRREAVHLAAVQGHGETVSTLLQLGADLSSTDPTLGRTSLEIIMDSVARPIRLLDDLLDSFMDRDIYQPTTDSDYKVTLKYLCLLKTGEPQARQLIVLDAVNNSGHERLQQRLFLHPLIETFLHYKREKLKFFFNFIVYSYIIHIASLTGLALMTYVYQEGHLAFISRIILFFTLTPTFLMESLNLTRFERFYFQDIESWIKWSVILSSIIVVLQPDEGWVRYLTAIAVLLAWIELLFLIPKSPKWDMYVLMFFKVTANVFEVFSTFVFLILGFVFCFVIVFNGEAPFNSLWDSICKVIIMMVELDYTGAFEETENEYSKVTALKRILYLTFVLTVVLVLTNLITSMSVSDVAELEKLGKAKRLSKQAASLSLVERYVYNDKVLERIPFIYNFIQKRRSVPVEQTVYPNKPEDGLPRAMRSSILMTILDRDEPSQTDNLAAQLSEIMEEIKDMKTFEIGQIKNMINEMSSKISSQQKSSLSQ